MTDQPFSFADGFPPADSDAWLALVEKSVAGGLDKLMRESEDGVTIRPVYSADDAPDAPVGLPGAMPFVRGGAAARPGHGWPGGGWDVRQPHRHPDPAVANKAILEDLERGATSVRLAVGDEGLRLGGLDDLDRALDGVYLDLAAVDLDAGADAPAAAAMLMALWGRRGVAPVAVAYLGVDPIGSLARDGALPLPLDAALADLGALAGYAAEHWPGTVPVKVDGSVWYGAGATEAQDLACCIATGTAYLRALTAAGLPVETACRQIAFSLDLGTDIFDAIAKLRAARRLWARVCEASGAGEPDRALRLGAALSMRAVTRRDPWVNMLRNTSACFAAAVGGADWISLPPHSAAVGLPDSFARRIARNVHVVLQEESHLGQVADPAGGSWYVESLTDGLARAAWARFQDIERAGGMVAALRDGLVQSWLEATNATRATDIARRKRPITGVSEFPNLAEPDVDVEPVADAVAADGPAGATEALPGTGAARIAALVERAAGGASLSALTAAMSAGLGDAETMTPLLRIRLAAGWEALRDASDRHLAAQGTRPRIFMAALGPVARHTARASFARNVFEAGGIEAVGSGGYDTAEAVATAFRDSGATIAVLCGGDDDYADLAADMASALKSAGCTRLWLAGRAGDRAADWAAAGIDGYIGVGTDILGTLREAHRHLGLAEEGAAA